MVSLLTKKQYYNDVNYYNDLFINKSSILNQVYIRRKDYVQSQILKLTFDIVKISWHIFLKDITDYAATSKVS